MLHHRIMFKFERVKHKRELSLPPSNKSIVGIHTMFTSHEDSLRFSPAEHQTQHVATIPGMGTPPGGAREVFLLIHIFFYLAQ